MLHLLRTTTNVFCSKTVYANIPDDKRCDQCAKERPPQGLEGEVVADLFKGEENSSDGGSECHGDAGS